MCGYGVTNTELVLLLFLYLKPIEPASRVETISSWEVVYKAWEVYLNWQRWWFMTGWWAHVNLMKKSQVKLGSTAVEK